MIRAASTTVVRNQRAKKTTAQNGVEGDKSAQAMPCVPGKNGYPDLSVFPASESGSVILA